MATCSCGLSVHWARVNDRPAWYFTEQQGNTTYAFPVDFCPRCGDRLLPNGTVEPRAELERDKARLDKLGCWPHQIRFAGANIIPVLSGVWEADRDENGDEVIIADSPRDLADALPETKEE